MYTDLYTNLSQGERKALENYHKKLTASKQSTPKSHLDSSKARSQKPKISLSKQNSSKELSNAKRSTSKSSLSSSKTFKPANPDEKPNIKYEVEKLLRALYRHSVICAEFKQELKDVGGLALLDEYLKYRELKSLD